MATPKPSKVSIATLRQAFLDIMRNAGQPLERIDGPHEIYRLPNGKTVRLRANNQPGLMAKAASGDPNARLTFEGEDYVGIAYPEHDVKAGTVKAGTVGVLGYLVPSKVATKAIRAGHKHWLATPGRNDRPHDPDNRMRVIRFDGDPARPGRGFNMHWQEYLVGFIELPPDGNDAAVPLASTESAIQQKVEACKRELAALTGRPVSAISISISY